MQALAAAFALCCVALAGPLADPSCHLTFSSLDSRSNSSSTPLMVFVKVTIGLPFLVPLDPTDATFYEVRIVVARKRRTDSLNEFDACSDKKVRATHAVGDVGRILLANNVAPNARSLQDLARYDC